MGSLCARVSREIPESGKSVVGNRLVERMKKPDEEIDGNSKARGGAEGRVSPSLGSWLYAESLGNVGGVGVSFGMAIHHFDIDQLTASAKIWPSDMGGRSLVARFWRMRRQKMHFKSVVHHCGELVVTV